MAMYKVFVNGEEEDEVFSTEEDAKEYVSYLHSCAEVGNEILFLSNPGDYDEEACDPDDIEYEIVEID